MIVRQSINGVPVIRSIPLGRAVLKKMETFAEHHGREPDFAELRALAATSVPVVYRREPEVISWRNAERS